MSSELRDKILSRLQEAADEAFDEETIDSDGLDQAERDGLLRAMEIVQDEFAQGGAA